MTILLKKHSQRSIIQEALSSIPQLPLSDLSAFKYVTSEGINKISLVYTRQFGICIYRESSQFTEFSIQLAIDRENAIKFQRIAHIHALRHPKLLSYYALVVEDGKYSGYLLEKAEDRTLESYLDTDDIEEKLTVERILDWAIQLARALLYCQMMGLVHGAIKPESIHISEDESTVKLGHFLFELNPDPTLTIRHTRHDYSAPEVILDTRYSPACDIYSFGMLLYALLYRKRPFAGANRRLNNPLNFRAFLEKGGRPEFEANATLPLGLQALIEDCWRTDPKDRLLANTVLERLLFIQNGAGDEDEILVSFEKETGDMEEWDVIKDFDEIDMKDFE